jgi:uncharacterized protein YpmB
MEKEDKNLDIQENTQKKKFPIWLAIVIGIVFWVLVISAIYFIKFPPSPFTDDELQEAVPASGQKSNFNVSDFNNLEVYYEEYLCISNKCNLGLKAWISKNRYRLESYIKGELSSVRVSDGSEEYSYKKFSNEKWEKSAPNSVLNKNILMSDLSVENMYKIEFIGEDTYNGMRVKKYNRTYKIYTGNTLSGEGNIEYWVAPDYGGLIVKKVAGSSTYERRNVSFNPIPDSVFTTKHIEYPD